jgi:hypothetical protein
MRVTLLQQIKPEYVERIKASEYKYSSSVILAKLESSAWYGELTINEVSEIYGMCNIDTHRVSAWDLRFGDNLLIEEEDNE